MSFITHQTPDGPACPALLVPPPYTQEQGKLAELSTGISQTILDAEGGDPVGPLPSEVGLTQVFLVARADTGGFARAPDF